MNLADIGLTIEELQDRVVNRLCEQLVSQLVPDEDGEFYLDRSPIGKRLDRLVRERIDAAVNDVAEKHVLPRVSEMVESLTLQATNSWGEARGEKLSFRVKLSLSPEVALAHAGLLKGGLTGNGFVRLSEPPAATDSKTADARTASAW